MDRLILASHGETDGNVGGLLNGDPSAPVALTPRGRDEARRLGEQLAGEPLGLCVTSHFPRTQETAGLALAGRDVPRLVVPELGDPDYGVFEGRPLADYRAWAGANPSSVGPPGGGEARLALVRRYVRGFGALLERPEAVVLAVLHSLPVGYLLGAREGRAPEPRVALVENARPYPVTAAELERALGVLEAWCAAPTW